MDILEQANEIVGNKERMFRYLIEEHAACVKELAALEQQGSPQDRAARLEVRVRQLLRQVFNAVPPEER